METETPPGQIAADKTAAPEPVGRVIRIAETRYKLIDPKTAGVYLLTTQTPWSDERIIKYFNVAVRKKGRVQAGETATMEAPN